MSDTAPAPRRRRSSLPLVLLLLLTASGSSHALAQPIPGPARPGPVRLAVGYSANVFVEVDAAEARSAARVWSEQVLRRIFPGGIAESVILDGDKAVEEALLEKRIDLVVFISDQFLRLRDRVPLVPALVSATDQGPFHTVLLLVHRDAGIGRLDDLRGKRLMVSREQTRGVQMTWLETILMKEASSRTAEFFSTVRDAENASKAILPVFFRQADACVTTLQSFQVASDLNPQLGRDLVVLAQSASLAGGVLAFRADYDATAQGKLTAGLLDLDKDPSGAQILQLFRVKRLFPWRSGDMETMIELAREHERLSRGFGRRR